MDQSALSFENFFVYYFIINKKYIGIKNKERKKDYIWSDKKHSNS